MDQQNPQNPPNPPNPPNPQNPPNQPYQPKSDRSAKPSTATQMNWSYFKLEFSGKAEEDATVHLLKTNDWVDTYNFPEHIKVR